MTTNTTNGTQVPNLVGVNVTDLLQQIQKLQDAQDSFTAWQEAIGRNMDEFFLITMGTIIYLMQGGFAFLEAGSVRSKNTTNILIKNLLDSFISGVSYWLFGYAFAFGNGNAFIGNMHFGHHGMEYHDYAFWFFHFVFAATAATIVSGAVAERCDFTAYLVYSILLTGFIYPVLTHWAWAPEGWLLKGFTVDIDGVQTQISYADFAGSGVVHMLGGIAAFCGAYFLGPRIGRYNKETGQPEDIKGHSVPLAALGGFVLIFGFFAFNGSSQGAISNPGDGEAVATAVKNTIIAGSGGAFITLTLNKISLFGDKKWSFLTTLNGCLTGMVSVCASVNQIETYSALVIGIIGGVFYMIFTWLVLFKLKVDDPLDATAVHFAGGLWGVIATAFFSNDFGIFYHWDRRSGLHLGWQLVAVVAIISWTGVLCAVMFFILKKLNVLRVPFEWEFKGLDIPKHGEPAYPIEAYGHGWEEKGDTLMSMMKSTMKSASVVVNQTGRGSQKGLPFAAASVNMNAMRRAGDIKSMESNSSSLSSVNTVQSRVSQGNTHL